MSSPNEKHRRKALVQEALKPESIEEWWHPYFRRDHWCDATARETMRVCLKSANAMVHSLHPPRWIVILDEFLRFNHVRSRVVIDQNATIDCEMLGLQEVQSAKVALGDLTQLQRLLSTCTVASLVDISPRVLDGHPCILTLINGADKWLAACEFNLSGMNEAEIDQIGPQIARLLVHMRAKVWNC